MKFVFALFTLIAITGCAGSSGPTRPVTVEYQLNAATVTPLTAPLAIGGSTTINVLERRCVFAQYDPTLPVPSGTGCGSYYVPVSLTPSVEPMQNTNQPCPVSVTVTAPGTVSVTRTGPGDPLVVVGSTPGGCIVLFEDRPVNARTFNVRV